MKSNRSLGMDNIIDNKWVRRTQDSQILQFIKNNYKRISNTRTPNSYITFIVKLELLKNTFKAISNDLRTKEGDSIKNKLFEALNHFFYAADEMSKFVKDDILLKKTKTFFREYFFEYIYQGRFFQRGYKKPKGYPGDYAMLEIMYDNKPNSKGVGYILDQYFLSDGYVQAVRDRKEWMKKRLIRYLKQSEEPSINILNLACGSCREIREMLLEVNHIEKRINMTLVDQDFETLQFAKSKMRQRPNWLNPRFVQADVLQYVIKNMNAHRSKKYELIYSIGLADYLPDSYLISLINHSFDVLQRGGTLIVAHKNVRQYSAPVADWICDWRFIPRNKFEFLKIVKKSLPKFNYKLSSVLAEERLVYYIVITKDNNDRT